ncbi:MAG: hypothetical protein MI810_20055 [Flavobacteriales bacterium]|nr:hypothetical protein [Flavobacteriales bacterium]
MSEIKLNQLFPDDISQIDVSYFTGMSRITDYFDIMVVKYTGKYGIGSAGNGDAHYMYGRGEYGLSVYDPMGVILDFTDLDYQWGDKMDMVFDVGTRQFNKEFPRALVVGDACKEAIGTLILGTSDLPASSEEWIFESLEEAWTYVETKIEKQMRS